MAPDLYFYYEYGHLISYDHNHGTEGFAFLEGALRIIVPLTVGVSGGFNRDM